MVAVTWCLALSYDKRYGTSPAFSFHACKMWYRLFSNSSDVVLLASSALSFFCRRVKVVRKGQQQQGTLQPWKLERLVFGPYADFAVCVHGSTGAALCFPDGKVQELTDSLGGHHLLWGLMGCRGGKQHFAVRVSKSVTKFSHLWCPACMYDKHLWDEARKRSPSGCEFECMSMFEQLGVSSEFSYQVKPDFWGKAFDFYNMRGLYWLQVDGRCHWYGMMGQSRETLLARGMQQCVAAVTAGAVLVRVHGDDVRDSTTMGAALFAATCGYSIVLTPTYAKEPYTYEGRGTTYEQALLRQLQCCDMHMLLGGCVGFRKR